MSWRMKKGVVVKPRRRGHAVACINIPLTSADDDNNKEETSDSNSKPALGSDPLLSTKTPQHIYETDPARLELAKAEEAKRKRHCAETMLALEKIQERINYSITEYEGDRVPQGEEMDASVNFEVVEDPNQLFNLLTDSTVRSKYHQKLTVFLIGYEEKKEALEGVLGQLQDFFVETQAGGTAELLQEVAEEELDLDEATKGLDRALGKAQSAVQKLVGIKKEMNHLMSIVAAYPDTNKGRKKMEKALLKAQEEVETLSKNLDEVQTSLKQSSDKCSQLQVQLDAKTKDCVDLRKKADQVKLLQVENEKLKADLSRAENALKESQEELSKAKTQLKAQPTVQPEALTDKNKTAEKLEEEHVKYQELQAEMEALVQTHRNDMESLKAEHEAESNEVRGRFEEQLKSLMEEDMFGEEGSLDGRRDSTIEDDDADGGDEVETSPMEETLPEEPADEVKKVDSPAASRASIPEADIMEAEKQIKELKRECERKAQEQVEDIKSKSRKMVALLQSQLADANSKAVTEKERFEVEIEELREQLSQEKHLTEELREALASLRDEVATLLESVRLKDEELEQAKEELRANAEIISSHEQQQQQLLETPFLRSDMLSPSPSGQPLQSPMQSISTIPLRALEVDSSSKSNIFPLSLEQSEISVDHVPLGSPLQSQLLSDRGSYVGVAQSSSPPPHNLSMLAMSRLSHHSSSLTQNTAVNHSHPIVVEWSKAYDSIIKFKENLIDILSEHQEKMQQFQVLIEELKSMELHTMDRKQEVQGQITEMRFSLVLFLHQIEQTLQEGFNLMLTEIVTREEQAMAATRARESQRGGAGGGAEVAHLTRQLKQNESRHRADLEKSKETIAHLSSQVESLKIELARLHSAVSSHEEKKEDAIMFTRLDSERNTKALKTALEKDRISAATFSQLIGGMEDYLSLPSQRLTILTQRWQEKTTAAKLVQQVQRSCPSPTKAVSIVEGIAEMEARRQRKFSTDMGRMGEMRTKLAHSLTSALGHVEKETGEFLIKPVFCRRPPPPPRDLITPIPRPFPAPRQHSSHRASTGVASRASTTSSNVRMIQSYLQSQRQRTDPQQLIRCIDSANSPYRTNPGSPTPRDRSSKQSHTSLSSRHISSPRLALATEGTWNMDISSVPQRGEGEDKGGERGSVQPSFSKMVELDISRHRQTDTLLGQILPNMQLHNYTPIAASPTHHSHSHTPIMGAISRHHTPSQHKLMSLPEESSSSHTSSTHSSQRKEAHMHVREGWIRPQLPPIDVPSQTDTLAVV